MPNRICLVIIILAATIRAQYICDTAFSQSDTMVSCTSKVNGNIVIIANYKNGKLHGTQKSWFASGTLKSFSRYNDGDIIDTSYSYHPSGKLKAIGVNNGKWFRMGEDGDTMAIGYSHNGHSVGLRKVWYKEGKLKSLINYNDSGQKHGLSEEWREDGTRKDSTVYDNGDIIEVRRYFENGKLHYHKYQKPVNRDINAVYYDLKGKKVGEVKNGKGTYVSYSEDGKSAEKVYMENDEVVKIEKNEME